MELVGYLCFQVVELRGILRAISGCGKSCLACDLNNQRGKKSQLWGEKSKKQKHNHNMLLGLAMNYTSIVIIIVMIILYWEAGGRRKGVVMERRW